MAGASMNDIKSRIKSVESTMQITKAMELVATSKLRRLRERAEGVRPFTQVLGDAIDSLSDTQEAHESIYSNTDGNGTLYVVIAGDRGLAGGYNSNIFRLTSQLIAQDKDGESVILPLGKKCCEYYRRRNMTLFGNGLISSAADVGVGACMYMANEICKEYLNRKFGRVVVVYTRFASMISQMPVYEQILPLERDVDKNDVPSPIFEGDVEEILTRIVPMYVGGILYSAVCEALASESGARRAAMNSANKNASEMIDGLMLKYNRARQAVITQEINEIVSGAEAL